MDASRFSRDSFKAPGASINSVILYLRLKGVAPGKFSLERAHLYFVCPHDKIPSAAAWLVNVLATRHGHGLMEDIWWHSTAGSMIPEDVS